MRTGEKCVIVLPECRPTLALGKIPQALLAGLHNRSNPLAFACASPGLKLSKYRATCFQICNILKLMKIFDPPWDWTDN